MGTKKNSQRGKEIAYKDFNINTFSSLKLVFKNPSFFELLDFLKQFLFLCLGQNLLQDVETINSKRTVVLQFLKQ